MNCTRPYCDNTIDEPLPDLIDGRPVCDDCIDASNNADRIFANVYNESLHLPQDCWWCWMFVMQEPHEPEPHTNKEN